MGFTGMPGLSGKGMFEFPEEGLNMPTLMVELDQIMRGKSLRVQERGHQLPGPKSFAENRDDTNDRFYFSGNTFGLNPAKPVMRAERF